MTDLAPGTEFAGCRIEAVAARGGMGVIYRATQMRLRRPVALKLIAADRAADRGFRERFEREARLTASIDHPNVIPVYGAGEEDGRLYLAMRWVAGTDLQRLLREQGRLEPARAAAVVAQVAAALDAAHAAGLVHRDVKPANVLLAGEDHVYLSDFGITLVTGAETRITDSDHLIGTVDFMAPEHLERGHTDARSDVYALGALLYATLTGAPPFRRDSVASTILAHLRETPPRPSDTPGVSPAFDAIVARALAKDPADRYPSAGELGRAALAAAAGTAPESDADATAALATASPATAPLATERIAPTVAMAPETAKTQLAPAQPGRKLYRRRRAVVVAALVAGVVAAGVAIAVAAGGGGSGEKTGPLTAAEVRGAARAFARAYAKEDADALRRALAPDVVRVATPRSPGTTPSTSPPLRSIVTRRPRSSQLRARLLGRRPGEIGDPDRLLPGDPQRGEGRRRALRVRHHVDDVRPELERDRRTEAPARHRGPLTADAHRGRGRGDGARDRDGVARDLDAVPGRLEREPDRLGRGRGLVRPAAPAGQRHRRRQQGEGAGSPHARAVAEPVIRRTF